MNKKLLVIGHVWPEPKSSAAGSRMLQLLDLFLSEKYNITFACANNKTDNAFPLETLGIEESVIQLNSDSFDVFISDLQPTVVLFDRFITEEQFGWRVAEQCPKALRILDTEDLHGLRKGRGQAVKDAKPFDRTYLLNDTMKRELASLYRCDLSLIISKAEMRLLIEDLKVEEQLLYYLPFLLEPITNDSIKSLPNYEERQDFITIGNFLHEPNFDAVLQLKQHIWPIIRSVLPNTKLHIYGAYASQKVTQLHNTEEGFLVHGFTEDVAKVMQQAKVCLAPLRFGAGIKGKVIDAMQNGTPCIMSTIAAEGIFNPELVSESLDELSITDDNSTFAKKAIELYSSKHKFEKLQDIGFKCINNNLLKLNFSTNFTSKIKNLLINIDKYRQENIVGQVLQYQSLQSTKYLSKWIEEKNKS